jgi:dTDP-4-dehydrorhamnose 3,5-epimerase
MIEGVRIKHLKPIRDYRGLVMEILRSDDEIFKKFGQAYITTVKPGIVKGWHYHNVKTDNFCCITGSIRLGLYDLRENSPTSRQTQEIILSIKEPKLVKIPPEVAHGFECAGDREAIVVSLPTEPYNSTHPDVVRIDPLKNDIPFKWTAKKGG